MMKKILWGVVLVAAGWGITWLAHKNFDKEFPPVVTLSVRTTEIRVTDKDVSRLKVFVQMAENAKWQRYPAEQAQILCQLTPSGNWYRAQCKLGSDGVTFVNEELSSRSKVKDFLWSLYKDATGAVPATRVLLPAGLIKA